jgi:hypothetical protein
VSDPKANNVLVETLGTSLRYGGSALSDVPGLLKRLLEEEAWREFVTRRGELVRHERFTGFVTTPPLQGLGADVDLVRRVIEHDKEALDLLDQALQNPHGGNHTSPQSKDNNVTLAPQGNSRAKALRKLRTEADNGNGKAAELHAEVLAERISAHAAMVQAGFRPKTISVPVSKPERVAAYLRKHMPRESLLRLVELLTKEDGESDEARGGGVTLPAAAPAALSQLVSLLTHRPEYGGVNAEVPSG